MLKFSKILHIGKIICEGVAVALGIAALFTPAAPVIIIAAICAVIAWACDTGESVIDKTEHLFAEYDDGNDDENDLPIIIHHHPALGDTNDTDLHC